MMLKTNTASLKLGATQYKRSGTSMLRSYCCRKAGKALMRRAEFFLETMEDDPVQKITAKLATIALPLFFMLLPVCVHAAAATTGTEFQTFYNFINAAATGFLGRAIAITGGLIALGVAAASGRYVLAIGGIILAIFGSLGPQVVNAIFGAVI